jgi:hypothetical protein
MAEKSRSEKMEKNERSYLQTELDEVSLAPKRTKTKGEEDRAASLLNAFRRTATRMGSDFNLPPASNVDIARFRNTGNR